MIGLYALERIAGIRNALKRRQLDEIERRLVEQLGKR